MMPSRIDPIAMRMMIARGLRLTALPMTSGCRTSPSKEPTKTVSPIVSRAMSGPRSASATIAAKNVAIGAPMTGMKAPKKTIAARAGAMGTCRIVRPMKTRIESQRATMTTPRV